MPPGKSASVMVSQRSEGESNKSREEDRNGAAFAKFSVLEQITYNPRSELTDPTSFPNPTYPSHWLFLPPNLFLLKTCSRAVRARLVPSYSLVLTILDK